MPQAHKLSKMELNLDMFLLRSCLCRWVGPTPSSKSWGHSCCLIGPSLLPLTTDTYQRVNQQGLLSEPSTALSCSGWHHHSSRWPGHLLSHLQSTRVHLQSLLKLLNNVFPPRSDTPYNQPKPLPTNKAQVLDSFFPSTSFFRAQNWTQGLQSAKQALYQ